jgi:hypothetical protein
MKAPVKPALCALLMMYVWKRCGEDKQDFLGLLVGTWVTILVDVVLVCLRGLVRCGTCDEFVGEASFVIVCDLLGEVSRVHNGYGVVVGDNLLVGLCLIGVVAEPTHCDVSV